MIIYGTFTETSVPKLFMAGVDPGPDHDGAASCSTSASMRKLGPASRRAKQGPRSAAELLRALADVVPFVVLIAGTLGGLYFGVVTTTEARSIGCILSILPRRHCSAS